VIARGLSLLSAVALAVLAAWLLVTAVAPRGGVVLDPPRLTLRAGERAEIRLVNRELEVVAWSFRLRFDEDALEVVAATPAHANLLDGGPAIHMPVRRTRGTIEMPGDAVTGGRVLKPFAPVYRFVVRARRAGTTTLAVEDFTAIGLADERRELAVAPAEVIVRP
jgi:hypothetical protein